MSIQETKLQAIANAIREKDGTTEPIPANDFPARIRAIKTGSGFAIPLVVTADVGTVITAVNGDTTVTGTVGDSGSVTLTLPSPGDWSVSAQLGDKTKGPEIVSVQDVYAAEFSMLSRLPGGYTEVEYIKFDAGSSIDTGIISNSKSRWVMDIEADASSYAYAEYLLYASVSNVRFQLYFYTRHTEMMFYYCTQYNSYLRISIDGVRTVIDADIPNLRLTIGDSQKALTGSINKSVQGNTYIGKYATNKNDRTAVFKLYSSQMYDDDELAADFVPCISPTGTIGLYDVVRGTFYGNAGTGTFTAGP